MRYRVELELGVVRPEMNFGQLEVNSTHFVAGIVYIVNIIHQKETNWRSLVTTKRRRPKSRERKDELETP